MHSWPPDVWQPQAPAAKKRHAAMIMTRHDGPLRKARLYYAMFDAVGAVAFVRREPPAPLLTGSLAVQKSQPSDPLLQWKTTSVKFQAVVIILVNAADVEVRPTSGKGKAKAPDLQAVLKPAFNMHAVREPGAYIMNMYNH